MRSAAEEGKHRGPFGQRSLETGVETWLWCTELPSSSKTGRQGLKLARRQNNKGRMKRYGHNGKQSLLCGVTWTPWLCPPGSTPMTSCDHLRQPALQRSSHGVTTSICISLLGLPEQSATDRVAETAVLDPRSQGQGAGRVGFLGGGLSPRLIELTSLHTNLQTASFQRWERASHQHRE